MNRNTILLLVYALLILSIAASSTEESQRSRLLKIAVEYRNYTRTDKLTSDHQRMTQWATSLCIAYDPKHPQSPPSWVYDVDSIHFSKASPMLAHHANKLYSLFVRDIASYTSDIRKPQPLGQALVKETWDIKEVDSAYAFGEIAPRKNEANGKWYIPSAKSHLFIMYKEPETVENDNGWVYGIVDATSQNVTVLNQGKLSTCVYCHKDTKYDRVFGL